VFVRNKLKRTELQANMKLQEMGVCLQSSSTASRDRTRSNHDESEFFVDNDKCIADSLARPRFAT
jgi:hypothetical protein